MLRAAVQVLHSAAISADPAERLALDLVGAVLSDRLDGWGWPSLTHVGTRRGTNSYQASARRLGAGYIQTVDCGTLYGTPTLGRPSWTFSIAAESKFGAGLMIIQT